MKSKVYTYAGDALDVTYDVKRCIHAEACIHGQPAVFDPQKRPWIAPDGAAGDALAETILHCPTGALHFVRKDGGVAEEPPAHNVLTIAADGPVYVHGDCEIVNTTGETLLQDTRLALCRCGLSKNKPLCDNSHLKGDFHAASAVTDNQAETAGYATGGPLKLTPAPDGPVLLQGHFELRTQDGTSIFRGTKAALCRCGASANKPFCDGTHRQIGFTSED